MARRPRELGRGTLSKFEAVIAGGADCIYGELGDVERREYSVLRDVRERRYAGVGEPERWATAGLQLSSWGLCANVQSDVERRVVRDVRYQFGDAKRRVVCGLGDVRGQVSDVQCRVYASTDHIYVGLE